MAQQSDLQSPDKLIAQLNINQMSGYLQHISRRKRKEPVVLFFGRDGFCDNSKYLFLHCLQNAPFQVMWCSPNANLVAQLTAQGLPAIDLKADLNRTLALLLSAAVAVYCVNPLEAVETEFFMAALAGAKQVQLWHGVGSKRLDMMLLDKLQLMNMPQMRTLRWACSVDTVVSPSRRYDRLWYESFGASELIRAGLPRNEVLLRPPTAMEEIGAIDASSILAHDGLRILWAPTFCQSTADLPAWTRRDLAEAILRGAAGRNPKLFVRPHPFDHLLFVRNGAAVPDCATLLSSNDDVYPVLRHFDILITDRSSLVSDFLLLDRPVLLLDDASKPVPESDFVYDTPDPGLVADYADAEQAVRDSLDDERFGAARHANREAIFESDPSTACQDVLAVLRRLVDETQIGEPVLL